VDQRIICIVEDDEATRSSLAALTRATGFIAKAYRSAEEFLDCLGYVGPCCIISDIQMPGLSGIDLKQRLTELNCDVPVIMITARADERLHKQAMAAGAFCLLRKPFKSNELIECVNRAIAEGSDRSGVSRVS
jgi:FixJ family two-component response regulator